MMQVESDSVHRRFLYWFAGVWSFFAMSYMAAVTFIPLSERGQHFADIILGFLLGTVVATILGYFFGGLFKHAAGGNGGAIVLKPELSVTSAPASEVLQEPKP